MFRTTLHTLGLALLLATATAATAQEAPRVVPVQFAAGTSSATLKGQVRGHEAIDYRLRARAGQTLEVELRASNSSTYFNLIAPDAGDVAVFNSSMAAEGNRYSGVLAQDGEYTVRVYQMRNAARRGNANITLRLGIR